MIKCDDLKMIIHIKILISYIAFVSKSSNMATSNIE